MNDCSRQNPAYRLAPLIPKNPEPCIKAWDFFCLFKTRMLAEKAKNRQRIRRPSTVNRKRYVPDLFVLQQIPMDGK